MFSGIKMNGKHKRRGSLTFEWIIISTIMAIGILTALGALRNALNETAEVVPENICNLSTEIQVAE